MSTFLYLEIASSLRGRIERGDFEDGRLPSERHLTSEYGVQRATVRRALKALEREGKIFRDATRGTFAGVRADVAPLATSGQGRGLALVLGRAADTTAPGDIARGMAQIARDAGRFLVWFDTPATPGHAEAEVPDPGELAERGVVACALWPQVPASAQRLRALRDAMPVVVLDRKVPGFEADFVGIDDVDAGRRVTEHLLAVGHRRIGFVAVEAQATTVLDRYRGWAGALYAAGITPHDRWALLKPADLTGPEDDALMRLLDGGGDPVTAVVCTNDTVAAHVLRGAELLGRKVGSDFGVTGFGNTFSALLDAVGLTTVEQPFEAMGRMAGEILRSRLEGTAGDIRTQEVKLPVSLVVRRSCGVGVYAPTYT